MDATVRGFVFTAGFAATLGPSDFAGAALVTTTAAGLAGVGLVLTLLATATLLEVTARLAWMGANTTARYRNCQRSFFGVAVKNAMLVLQ